MESTPMVAGQNKELARRRSWYRGCAVVNLCVALVFLAAAIAIPLVVDDMLDKGFRENAMLIDADEDSFASWADTSVKGQYYKFFVFNVTNPEEYVAGANVEVEAVGPFYYESILRKINLNYSADGEEVTFNNWQQAEFMPERSVADTDDLLINVIDPVYMSMVATREVALFYLAMDCCRLAPAMNNTDVERLFETKSVRDVFLGYPDEIAQLASSGTQDGYPGVLQVQANETEASALPPHAMFTGKSDLSKVREYSMYDGRDYYNTQLIMEGMQNTPLWGSDEANKVRGRDVFQWAPGLDEDSELEFFVDPMRRPVPFHFSGQRPEYHGLETLRFVINEDAAFGEDYFNEPDNDGFLFNVSRTFFGGPNYLFNPMMMDAPTGAADTINGMEADREEHTTFIDVEPRTGATLNARIGFQLSLHVPGAFPLRDVTGTPIEDVVYHENIQEGYVPLFYTQVEGMVNQDDAESLRDQLSLADNLYIISMAVGYSLFGICLLLSIYLFYKTKAVNKQMAINTRNRLLGDLAADI